MFGSNVLWFCIITQKSKISFCHSPVNFCALLHTREHSRLLPLMHAFWQENDQTARTAKSETVLQRFCHKIGNWVHWVITVVTSWSIEKCSTLPILITLPRSKLIILVEIKILSLKQPHSPRDVAPGPQWCLGFFNKNKNASDCSHISFIHYSKRFYFLNARFQISIFPFRWHW